MKDVIKVLYEDDFCICFDKPPGLIVTPSPRQTGRTFSELVNSRYRDSQHRRLHPCHRLDRETSGCILFARGKKNQQLLMEEFRKGLVEKTYTALVRGCPQQRDGEIKSRVRDVHQRKFHAVLRGKPAVTRYRVMSVKKAFSVVEVSPLTGRTHQIRIHFRQIGHPLLGERVYAFGKDFPVRFRRLALHAVRLSWIQPVTGRRIKVKSDMPEDMQAFIKRGG